MTESKDIVGGPLVNMHRGTGAIGDIGLDDNHLWNKLQFAVRDAQACNIKRALGWLLEAEGEAQHISGMILRMPLRQEPFHKTSEALAELVKGLGDAQDLFLKALIENCGCVTKSQR